MTYLNLSFLGIFPFMRREESRCGIFPYIAVQVTSWPNFEVTFSSIYSVNQKLTNKPTLFDLILN